MPNTHDPNRALMGQIAGVLTTAIGERPYDCPAYCFTLKNVRTQSSIGLAMGLCLKDPETSNTAKTELAQTRSLLEDYRCTFKLNPIVSTQVLKLGKLTLKLANLMSGYTPLPDLVVIDFVTATRAAHRGFNRQSSSVKSLEPDTDSDSLQGLTGVLIACHMESKTLPVWAKHQLGALRTALLTMKSDAPCPFLKN